MIALESITLIPMANSSSIWINVKIRNLTDEKKDYIKVTIQALDTNGDVIKKTDVAVNDVEPGQACNSSGYQISCPYEQIASLKVVSYAFGFRKRNEDGTLMSNTFTMKGMNYFAEPLVFQMSEVKTENAEIHYLWMPVIK